MRLVSSLAVAVCTAAVCVAVPITSAHAVSTPTRISTAPYRLATSYTLNSSIVAALDRKLGDVSVATVMNDANHTREPLCHASTITQVNGPQGGFCYEPGDDTDCHNTPQGITTSRDAVGSVGNGRYDGHQIVVTSWYYHTNCGDFGEDGTTTRSRLTFVDWDSNYPNAYRKVLLVQPTGSASSPNYTDIPIHAGGIAWYGNYLYVADTSHGLRIFDMRKIWTVDTSGSSSAIGLSGGSYKAHNYKYVLPQIGVANDVSSSRLTWSSVALDRAEPSLVMAEYETTSGHRAVRFPLDPSTHQLAITRPSGDVLATEALSLPYSKIQSALSHNGRWWFASSGDQRLYYWDPGHAVVAHTWVSYCEDLSYWEDPNNPDLIWSLREPRGGRVVFYTPQADLS